MNSKNKNRREFLKEAGSIMGAGLSLSLLSTIAAGDEKKSEVPTQVTPSVTQAPPEYKIPSSSKEELKPLIKRSLGKTGINTTIVSMGVMNCSDPAVLLRAFDLGINFYDTADCYMGGRNEEMVGNTFSQNKMREKIFIQTKVHIGDEKTMQDSVDRSLKRLKTDYIDVLVWHGLNSVEDVNNERLQEFMDKQKKSGKVKFTGFSTHSNMTELILAAAEKKKHDVILTTYNYFSPQDLKDAIKKAAEAGIGIVAMKTQKAGKKNSIEIPGDPHPVLLKTVLADSNVATAVPGVTSIEQIESLSMVGRDKIVIEKSDLNLLKSIELAVRGNSCIICGQCNGKCPYGLYSQDLMRASVYLYEYGNFDLAKNTFEKVIAECGQINCANCSKCAIKCSNQINIKEKIIDAVRLLA